MASRPPEPATFACAAVFRCSGPALTSPGYRNILNDVGRMGFRADSERAPHPGRKRNFLSIVPRLRPVLCLHRVGGKNARRESRRTGTEGLGLRMVQFGGRNRRLPREPSLRRTLPNSRRLGRLRRILRVPRRTHTPDRPPSIGAVTAVEADEVHNGRRVRRLLDLLFFTRSASRSHEGAFWRRWPAKSCFFQFPSYVAWVFGVVG